MPGRNRGFTLIELLVVIAIIAVLAAFLFPVFASAREASRKVVCLSNLKQIAAAVEQYATDHDELYPVDASSCRSGSPSQPCSTANPDTRVETRIHPYVKSVEIYACPSGPRDRVLWNASQQSCMIGSYGFPQSFCFPGDTSRGRAHGYGWNMFLFRQCRGSVTGGCAVPGFALAAITKPSEKVMLADAVWFYAEVTRVAFANHSTINPMQAANADQYWPWAGGGGAEIDPKAHTRHSLGQNVIHFDAHAKWYPYQAFTGEIPEAEAWFAPD